MEIPMRKLLFILAAIAAAPVMVTTAPYAGAQTTAQQPADSGMADGEVRRVDKDAKKLTIRHGPIKNLDMPAMTMVFQVKDAAMLDRVNTGDKIKFSAERIGGAYTVTGIEAVK
jgi:Cu(I)/Ag(I) efflux system periplasmic protein CusF